MDDVERGWLMDKAVFLILLFVIPVAIVAFDWQKVRKDRSGRFLAPSQLFRMPVLLSLVLVVVGYIAAAGAHVRGTHLVRLGQLGQKPDEVTWWTNVGLLQLGMGLMVTGLVTRRWKQPAPPP